MDNFKKLQNLGGQVIEYMLAGKKPQINPQLQQGFQNLTQRFQEFQQSAVPLSQTIKNRLWESANEASQEIGKNLRFIRPEEVAKTRFETAQRMGEATQKIQNRFQALKGDFSEMLKPRIQEFTQDFQTRLGRVNERFVQPVIQTGRDIASFAGLGETPEGLRRRENFAQNNPMPTQEQIMEQVLNFTPMGTRVAAKALTPAQKVAMEKMKGLITYTNELVKRGMPKAQAEKMGYKEGIKWLNEFDNSGGVLQGAKEAFENWVNTRRSSQIEGSMTKQSFKTLDTEGLQGIIDFQSKADTTGKYTKVKEFFDNKFRSLQDAGIEFNYKNDYLPGLWKNSKEEIEKAIGKTLGLRPSFTMKSVIKDYQEGIAAGLTPKYNNISELAGWYEQRSSKAIADKNFFDFLVKKNFIVPADSAPQGWITLSPDKFPKFSVKTGEGRFSGNFKAEPELAGLINNYLDDLTGPLQLFQSLATRVKNAGLAGGIPGTALNYHGAVNLFRRDLLSSKNPISTFFRDAKWMVNTKSAESYVNANLKEASFFTKHGLTLSAEDWGTFIKEMPKNKLERFEQGFEKWFGDPTFKRFLPAIKLDFAKKTFADLIKVMPEKEAASKASELANNVFGGINLDAIGRSKQTQGFLRSIILAPDWLETTLKLGKGLYQGIRHPKTAEYATYRTIARNMLLFYVGENVVNKVMSGHYMFENDGVANKFRIDTGTYDSNGKKRYLQSWGTAQDMARIPFQLAMGLAQGNLGAIVEPLVNRFSMPLSATAHLLTNQDYLHRPIYGKDRYGNPIPVTQQAGGIVNELAQGFGTPVQARAFIDFISGKSSFEESTAQAAELPIRYTGGAYSDKQKQSVAEMKSRGLTGADIGQSLELQKQLNQKDKKDTEPDFWESIFGSKEAQPAEPGSLQELGQIETKRTQQETYIRKLFEGAPDNEVKAELERQGLDYEQSRMVYLRGIAIPERSKFLKQSLTGLSNQDFQKIALYLAEEEILTDGVVNLWLDNGQINREQKKMLNQLIDYSKGRIDTPTGNAPKSKKLRLLPVRSIKPTIKKVTPVKITAPKLRSTEVFKPLRFKKPETKRLIAREYSGVLA